MDFATIHSISHIHIYIYNTHIHFHMSFVYPLYTLQQIGVCSVCGNSAGYWGRPAPSAPSGSVPSGASADRRWPSSTGSRTVDFGWLRNPFRTSHKKTTWNDMILLYPTKEGCLERKKENYERNPFRTTVGGALFVGTDRGIILQGMLMWCRISPIDSPAPNKRGFPCHGFINRVVRFH